MSEIIITQQLKETVPIFELLTVGESVALTNWQALAISDTTDLPALSDADLQEYLIAKSYVGLETLAEVDEMGWRNPTIFERTADLFATVTAEQQQAVAAMHPVVLGELRRHKDKYTTPAQRHCRDCTARDAAEVGNLRLLQWLHENNRPCPISAVDAAISGGKLECLKYMHTVITFYTIKNNSPPWESIMLPSGSISSTHYIDLAAACGQLECLKYLYENGFKFGEIIVENTAKGGHVECIKYLRKNGATWDERNTIDEAILHGHVECVKYLHEEVGCAFNDASLFISASGGHLECLTYIHVNHVAIDGGGFIDNTVLGHAARRGHFSCLKYLHENGYTSIRDPILSMIQYGGDEHVDCLIYLHQNGYPCGIEAVNAACKMGTLEYLKYVHSIVNQQDHGGYREALYNAVNNGQLNCLQYLHERGAELYNELIIISVQNADGGATCLSYLHDNALWDATLYSVAIHVAIHSCNFNGMVYLHEKGALLRDDHISAAAGNGDILCIKYLHEHGVSRWGEILYKDAISTNRLTIVEYLHQNNCPWSKEVTEWAVKCGKLQCLKYLCENGCPYDANYLLSNELIIQYPMQQQDVNECFTYIRTLIPV